jgi:short-subunit dehydrogenase
MAGLPPPDAAATCLITGASSGIGAAFARELAGRGYGVTLVARREERLKALARELEDAQGIRAEVLPCDLADEEARAALPARVEARGLRVEVLVNNAGIGTNGRFVELDRAREVEQVRVLCEAVVDLCGAFVPGMAAHRSGAVLIVSSSGAFQPTPNIATYAAAKAFSLSFGQALQAELRSSGVAVTTLCPGPVETEFFEANGSHPTQRVFPASMWITAADVARAGVEGLARNRRVVIPGNAIRAMVTGARFVPRSAQLRLLNRFYRGEPRP